MSVLLKTTWLSGVWYQGSQAVKFKLQLDIVLVEDKVLLATHKKRYDNTADWPGMLVLETTNLHTSLSHFRVRYTINHYSR